MPDINMQVFEEVKRKQLVTEIDVQTQVALDDYQVQLLDIANPTQSQDNIVIDRYGEFLPHWNESLDFDTWVKMSMEVAGKRILMLRGNSSVGSVSSIDNTFIFGDDFSSNLNKWTDHGGTSIANNVFSVVGSANWAHGITSIQSFSRPNILEMRWRDDTSGHNDFGFSDGGWEAINNVLETYYIDDSENVNIRDYNGGGSGAPGVDTGENAVLGTWYNTKIEFLGTGAKYHWGNAGLVGTTNTYSNSPGYVFIGVFNTASKVSSDWIFIRKYTATEPTWTAVGAEQNIAVALKSLGRAG